MNDATTMVDVSFMKVDGMQICLFEKRTVCQRSVGRDKHTSLRDALMMPRGHPMTRPAILKFQEFEDVSSQDATGIPICTASLNYRGDFNSDLWTP